MITTKIYGASDDLIEIEGFISEEFNVYDSQDSRYLAFSDGTLLQVFIDDNGIWRFAPTKLGTCEYSIQQCTKDDETGNSDIVTLEGDITWVAYCTEIRVAS